MQGSLGVVLLIFRLRQTASDKEEDATNISYYHSSRLVASLDYRVGFQQGVKEKSKLTRVFFFILQRRPSLPWLPLRQRLLAVRMLDWPSQSIVATDLLIRNRQTNGRTSAICWASALRRDRSHPVPALRIRDLSRRAPKTRALDCRNCSTAAAALKARNRQTAINCDHLG